MESNVLVRIEHLYKQYNEESKVLEDISLDIHKGEVVAIIGPSGAGKSTLLRCLNYLVVPTSGKITIDNVTVDADKHKKKEVIALRQHSAMVFQSYNLFKNKTVLQNVTEPLVLVHKWKKEAAKAKAMELLERVGMDSFCDAHPVSLSGGQQQRVAIVRALAVNPTVLLLDEPTSALDPELVNEVLQTIKAFAQEGVTMILVTHEISFARDVATRVLFMDGGGIAADGDPHDILINPTDPRLRQFLNLIEN